MNTEKSIAPATANATTTTTAIGRDDKSAMQLPASKLYFLLDGGMMGNVQSHLPASPTLPAWLRPLANHDDPHAGAGAILVDAQAATDAGQLALAHRLCDALPSRLHLSYVHARLDFDAMFSHFRRFVRVLTEDRSIYWLRFSDCRVIPVLASVLLPAQWRGLTAPMMQWEIHLRNGQQHDMIAAAGDENGNRDIVPAPAPLVLNDVQVERFIAAQEPDILLRKMGYTLSNMHGHLQAYWDRARQCIEIWQQSGSVNRNVLDRFARRVFEHPKLQPHEWSPLLHQANADYGNS